MSTRAEYALVFKKLVDDEKLLVVLTQFFLWDYKWTSCIKTILKQEKNSLVNINLTLPK